MAAPLKINARRGRNQGKKIPGARPGIWGAAFGKYGRDPASVGELTCLLDDRRPLVDLGLQVLG